MARRKKDTVDGVNKVVPIWSSKQPDVAGLGDAKLYIESKERILGGAEMEFVNSMWYSPELMPDIWQMPKSRMEILKWVRFFYNTDPYIYAITNMHTMYPFSMFDIVSSDEKVSEFYTKVAFNRNFNLYDLIMDMSLAYQKFGEAVLMGQEEITNVEGVEIFK